MKKLLIPAMFVAIASFGLATTTKDNWETSCAKCHGEDGKGQTKVGKKLKAKDYTDPKVQAELKDDAMLKAITDGVKDGDKEKMKGFKDELNETESKALIAFIRGMQGK